MPVSKLLLAAGALLSQATSVAVDDAVAMVQAGSQSQAAAQRALAYARGGRAMSTQGALSAADAAGLMDSFDHFNCTKHPKLCEEPFNCQTFSKEEFLTFLTRGFAPEGHANLRTWCMSPDYEDYVHTCIIEKDLVKAAHLQYEWALQRTNKTGVAELDGSYCFIEGHCSNEVVTKDTTLEEADRMCDGRYGEVAWRKIGMMAYPVPSMDKKAANPLTGFHDPRVTAHFLKLACAMGNYHCDVVYCKETYCKNPYYVRKYGHLLPKAPGHLLQTRIRV